MPFAPIILFVYNRPYHTQKTIDALKAAVGSEDSVLHIIADGPKKTADKESLAKVEEVRKLITKVKGFKEVILHLNEENVGLANTVINGVGHVLETSEYVITIEDDVIIGKHLLKYMNEALEKYKSEQKLMMVSGYAFNLPFTFKRHTSYFLHTGTTQAWGTWKRVWDEVDFEAKGYELLKTDNKLKHRFNVSGAIDYSEMLIQQKGDKNDKISSWAILFRWHLFINKGLTLFPPYTLIQNIGWDGTGKHSGIGNPYRDKISYMDKEVNGFPKVIIERKVDKIRLIVFLYMVKVRAYLRNKFK